MRERAPGLTGEGEREGERDRDRVGEPEGVLDLNLSHFSTSFYAKYSIWLWSLECLSLAFSFSSFVFFWGA